MNVSNYIDLTKKKPWRRRVVSRGTAAQPRIGCEYRIMTQDDFLNEVNTAAHAINSPVMSRRPIYGPTGKKDKNGHTIYACYDKFFVEKIIIEDKQITALAIWNTTKNCRAFVWQRDKQ